MNTLMNISNQEHQKSDLIRLIQILWNKKLWIVVFTLCAGLIAAGYSFTLKERWTSNAEVVPAKLYDLDNYLTLRKEYARVMGKDIDIINLSNQLFDKFDLMLNSADEREKFFLETDLYKRLVSKSGIEASHKILSDLIDNNFSIVKPDLKKEPNAINRKVYFSTDNPADSQYYLRELIRYLDKAAYQIVVDELLIDVREDVLDLKYEKERFERDLGIQNKIRISNLSNALEMAKLAGIKDYLRPTEYLENPMLFSSDAKIPLTESKASDNPYLFVLGEKYLKAQLDVLVSRDIVYPPQYYQIISKLSELEAMMDKIKSSKAQTILYQKSPNFPSERDKPNRSLIVLLGLIFGFVLSCFFVLIQAIFRVEKK